jgi:hypothetical protein
MGKMAICHDQTVFADNSLVPVFGSPVYSNKLTYSSTIAYKYIGIFTLEFQILWNSGDHSAGKDPAIFTDPCTLHDSNIGAYPGTITYLHILVNDRERIHFHIGSQPGIGMNVCMRVYHAVFIKKPPPQAETCKGNCYGQKRKFFYL